MQLFKTPLKKVFNVCVFCLCVSQVNSQVIIALLFGDKLNSDKLEFGLAGGVNLSNISNFYDTKTRGSFNLGLYFNIKLDDRWYIRAEAVPKFPTGASELNPYALHDANLDTLLRNADVTRKIKNIALPILIRYRIRKLLFAEAGPQLALRTKAKDVFESGDLTYENKIEDNITRFDFGFAIGVSQKFSKEIGAMAFGLRYYLGVTDIDKLAPGTQKNGIFQILVSVPVGTGKEKRKN
jgi:hypothetical protein